MERVNASADSDKATSPLEDSIEELRHLLPVQGPIDTFIHHNTLHSFEHLDFEDAVEEAARIYAADPYLPEDEFRELYHSGRIEKRDVEAELEAELGADMPLAGLSCTRHSLRRALLYRGITQSADEVSRWALREAILELRPEIDWELRRALIQQSSLWLATLRSKYPRSFELRLGIYGFTKEEIQRFGLAESVLSPLGHGDDDSKLVATLLWHLSERAVRSLKCDLKSEPTHHRELLKELCDTDVFRLIQPTFVQLCSRFCDQGISYWILPNRERGFLSAATLLFERRHTSHRRWMEIAAQLFRENELRKTSPLESIRDLLEELGIPEGQRGAYLRQNVLALRGWAGFIALSESRPSILRERPAPNSLHEFIVVQLIFLSAAVRATIETHGLPSHRLRELQKIWRERTTAGTAGGQRNESPRVQPIFELCQLLGVQPKQLARHGTQAVQVIVDEMNAFPSVRRRRIWQRAYERSFARSSLGAIKSYPKKERESRNPVAQVVFCIDEREESFRRHLEESSPDINTFGYPGFFSLPLAYQGLHHLHAESLCPVILEPELIVKEEPEKPLTLAERSLVQRGIAYVAREVHRISRSTLLGSFFAATAGHFSLFPLLLRVFAPALAGRMHEILQETELAHPVFSIQGFKVEADNKATSTIVTGLAALFESTGIAPSVAPFVVIMGHGSSSLNNPHESAHDCGACGGHRGAVNARLFARFANTPIIRESLAARGIVIPESTHVIGAYHDTCNDTITLFDIEDVPESHRTCCDSIARQLKEASEKNAAERARRFISRKRSKSPHEAAVQMLHRAEDFAEPRPEYGHATNAVAIVGRRERTRGLFFDRRAFLTSYNWESDPSGKILEGLLRAVIPVCGGINLEYYFSRVDRRQYGSGTKLPHNIVGRIGVMDGAASDLRTGLPWQMVEIHEPVRLVVLVEAPPERVANLLVALPSIEGLIRRRWVWLYLEDPVTDRFYRYGDGCFEEYEIESQELPLLSSSLSYCLHESRHLPFAAIRERPQKGT